MINIKPLLIEGMYPSPSSLYLLTFFFFILASYAKIAQVLNSCLFKEWSNNMKLIESLEQFTLFEVGYYAGFVSQKMEP
jgi:hypothetical protein